MYDNAVAESFFSTMENELVHERHYHTRADARAEIFEFIEVFYKWATVTPEAWLYYSRAV